MNNRDQLLRIMDTASDGRMSRRFLVQALGALGLSAPLITALADLARAEGDAAAAPACEAGKKCANRVVVSSWGGEFGDGQKRTVFEPFTKETGIEVVVAPAQPEMGLVEAQVKAGDVQLDLVNFTFLTAQRMANKGLLEKIDYASFDPKIISAVNPLVKNEFGCGSYFWSLVLAYSLDHFTADKHPESWKDYWNIGEFPGARALTGMDYDAPPLEIPMLAQGVAPDKLYPLDIEEAFRHLSGFRENIVTWLGYSNVGSQVLAQGEVAASDAGATNITTARLSGANIDKTWNQGLLYYDVWTIPKGAPNREAAHKLIEYSLRKDVNAALAKDQWVGTVNSDANDMLPEEVRRNSEGDPEVQKQLVKVDPNYWVGEGSDGKSNLERVYAKWASWIVQ